MGALPLRLPLACARALCVRANPPPGVCERARSALTSAVQGRHVSVARIAALLNKGIYVLAWLLIGAVRRALARRGPLRCAIAMEPATPDEPVLQKFYLYQTTAWTYLVGHDRAESVWRVLKFSRQSEELDVVEDPTRYTKAECVSLLRRINDGNLTHGGLTLVCKVIGGARAVELASGGSRSRVGEPRRGCRCRCRCRAARAAWAPRDGRLAVRRSSILTLFSPRSGPVGLAGGTGQCGKTARGPERTRCRSVGGGRGASGGAPRVAGTSARCVCAYHYNDMHSFLRPLHSALHAGSERRVRPPRGAGAPAGGTRVQP